MRLESVPRRRDSGRVGLDHAPQHIHLLHRRQHPELPGRPSGAPAVLHGWAFPPKGAFAGMLGKEAGLDPFPKSISGLRKGVQTWGLYVVFCSAPEKSMVGMRNGRLTAAAVFVLLMSSYTAEGLSPHAGSNLQPGACRAAFACNGAAAHLMPAWRSATCEFSGRAAQAGHVLPRARGVRAGGAGVAQWAMQQQKAGWSRPGELGQTMSQMVKEKRR